jgi:hypothetical protein
VTVSARRGGHVTRGERDHSAGLAVAAQDGLDGEAAERPQLAELVFGAAHRDARAEPRIETAALRSRGVSNPSSSA